MFKIILILNCQRFSCRSVLQWNSSIDDEFLTVAVPFKAGDVLFSLKDLPETLNIMKLYAIPLSIWHPTVIEPRLLCINVTGECVSFEPPNPDVLVDMNGEENTISFSVYSPASQPLVLRHSLSVMRM